MITFGCAFMNTVMTFYTLYLCVTRDEAFIQTVAVMRVQWEIFWSFVVLAVIQVASQVIKEVKIEKFAYKSKKRILNFLPQELNGTLLLR